MLLGEKMNGSLKSSFDRISPDNDVVQSNDSRSLSQNTNNIVVNNNNNNNNKKSNVHLDNKQQQQQHHNKQTPSSHSDHFSKKNYILLSDPFLKKCDQKIYRINGIVGPNEPPIHLKDPRNRLHSKFDSKLPLELPIPRFKIDSNYTGVPPAIEISIMNLNDNIRTEYLRDNILKKFGTIEKVEILHHPYTHQHLGLAKVTYFKSSSASLCVEKLNGQSVMGNVLSVFLDPFAKHINEAYHEIVNPTQNFNIPVTSDHENDLENVKKDSVDSASIGKLSNGYKSPERENLDWRISHMIRDPKIISQSALFGNIKNLRDSMNEEKEDILKTPPSPFLSGSLYLKWNRITREIEKGSDRLLIEKLINEESDRDNHHYDDMELSCSSNEDDHVETPNHSSQHFKDPFTREISQYSLSSIGKHLNGNQSASIGIKITLNRELKNSYNLHNNKDIRKPREFTFADRRKLCDEMIEKTHRLVKKELEEILIKDLYKKFTENYAFKLFDQWWDEQERVHADSKNTPVKAIEEMDSNRIVNVPLFNSRIENLIRDEHANEHQVGLNVPLALGRGLRAAMPKMPSFKKKLPKSSPRRQDFSDSEEESHVEEKENKRFKTPAQRRRRVSASSKSCKSDDDADESDNVSVSTKSTETSESESSVSSTSSSSSSESSDEEDITSDNESSALSVKSSHSARVSDSNSASQLNTPTRSESIYSPKSESILEPSSVISSVFEEEEEDEEDEEEEEEEEEKDLSEIPIEKESITSVPNDVSRKTKQSSDNVNIPEEIQSDHGSSTDTADEAVEEMRKLDALERKQKRTKKKNNTKDDPARREATEALMALAGLCDDQQIDDYELRDPISQEHNYAKMPIIETPKKRGRKPKVESEKKKGKGKLPQDENRAPDLYKFGAVATEMRKAKLGGKKVDEFEERKEIFFAPRTAEQELAIFQDIIKTGMDAEDRNYLKRSYEMMIQNRDEEYWWLKEVSWVDHPTTVVTISPPKQKKRKEERIHKTGCARSEGYYKIGFLEKQKYSHVANNAGPVHSVPDEAITRVRQLATTSQLSREARQNQRRLLATVDSAYTDLLKFSQLKFRKKQLKFSKSVIHDWGLFAMEPIAADEMIIEYVGERIRPLVADIREKKYEECGIGSSYLFRVDGECIVDATKCGNVARFINHSCNPNCYAKVVTVEGEKKIVIYSKQPIGVGEEITYDYKFPIEEDNKIACLCGAQGCRGYLN